MAADTLIRSILHLDPDTLSDAQWVAQVTMALWMERRQAEQLAKLTAPK